MLEKEKLKEIVNTILVILTEKNLLYGDSYFKLRDEYGRLSFLIRLTDKFNRLKALNSEIIHSKDLEDLESGDLDEDTILDIIGYCILELYYRKYYQR